MNKNLLSKIDENYKPGQESDILKIENIKTGLRPCAPDDMPVIGHLKKYPDVYVHSGLGGKAANSLACAKLTAELIVHGEIKTPLKISKDKYDVQRFNC